MNAIWTVKRYGEGATNIAVTVANMLLWDVALPSASKLKAWQWQTTLFDHEKILLSKYFPKILSGQRHKDKNTIEQFPRNIKKNKAQSYALG